MKRFEIPMVMMSLVGYCFLPGLDAPPARADFIFGAPTTVGAPIDSSDDDLQPCISYDNLEFYFARGIPSALWVSHRATPNSAWGPPSKLKLGSPAGASVDDWAPSITADGLTLYFNSNRPDCFGNHDLWMTTRATVENDDWDTPVNLGATVNSVAIEYHPCISPDQLELYFTSDRSGGRGALDLWLTTRASVQDDWGTPVNLGPEINTPAHECWAGISPDGLVLFFASGKPGGFSILDMYMTRRATTQDPWGVPQNLGPVINDTTWQSGSKVSPDGSTLYFMCGRPGGLGGNDIWQAPIIPIVDFSADGEVDLVDMVMLIDNWGADDTLYDIGPYAWGDGKVDVEDLKAFIAEWEKQDPPAQL